MKTYALSSSVFRRKRKSELYCAGVLFKSDMNVWQMPRNVYLAISFGENM